MRKTAVVFGLLLCLVLCAVPVFGADEPTQSADRHYNHFSTDIVRSYGMLDAWVAEKPGQRSVSFDKEINRISINYAPGDEGTFVTSSSVPIDDFMPFFLAGDKFVYYAGGGGTFEDNGGFTLLFSSLETGMDAQQPRAYEMNYVPTAQNTAGNATVRFRIKIPADATGGEYSVPYIGIYRVNDFNRSHFQFYQFGDSNFGTGNTDVAQGIFTPFDLNGLIDYERNQGYAGGYTQGQQAGYRDGKADGLDEGRTEGRAEGYQRGFDEGKSEGYAKGYADGTNEGGSAFYSLAGAVINVPIQGIRGLMNFDILGVNMLAFFGSILTLLALFWLIRLVV